MIVKSQQNRIELVTRPELASWVSVQSIDLPGCEICSSCTDDSTIFGISGSLECSEELFVL